MWNDEYGHWGMMNGGWAAMMLGGLMFLLLLAGLIALVVLLVRNANRGPVQGSPGANPPAPEDAGVRILRERLARGEIDEAEFESRMRALNRA